MLIQILCDHPKSWIIPYAEKLRGLLEKKSHRITLIHKHEEVTAGDILVLLSCEKLFKQLGLNKHNLVVHESALPLGKGWSPLTWQVLEGETRIPVTLIEATEQVDSGCIYGQTFIETTGFELVDELRELQGQATIELILDFIRKYPGQQAIEQVGDSTYYRRRKAQDSRLDENKSLLEQFNLLRVCDNEKYPAWFEIEGHQYVLKIYKK